MSVLLMAIYTFNAIPIKIPWVFFRELEQIILRFVQNQERPRNSQGNSEKENQSRGHHNARFQVVLPSCGHQDSVVLAQKQTHRSMEQNRESRSGPSTLWSTNIRQRRKDYPLEESLFNKWCWENWRATCRAMKLDHSLAPYTKINSKWMKDLNVRQDSIKILDENTGNTIFELGHSNFLQDTSMKAKKQKQKWTIGTSSR